MKNSNRLDFGTLAEVLGQRGLVDPQRLKILVQASAKSPTPLPEMLVAENLIGDWELSRVVCEIYGLPFLPVDLYPPNLAVLAGLDVKFLRQHALIPLSRHGQILTVCMPGLVLAETLGTLAAASDMHVMPVVGTVSSNNRWFADNLPVELEDEATGQEPGAWSKIFDESDAAVLLNLNEAGPHPPEATAA